MLCSGSDDQSNSRMVGQDQSSFQIHLSPLETRQKILLRWLKTVSSTVQGVDFDGS